MSELYVTLTKSVIGYKQDQKDTVRALGLARDITPCVCRITPQYEV